MKWLLLTLYLAVLAARLWLRGLNLRHLRRHGDEVPAGFEGVVDAAQLERACAYTLAGSRVGLIESLCGSLLLVLFLFGGLLPRYDQWIAGLADGFIAQGVLFLLGLLLAQTCLDIPFSLYRTFVLEARFQFNVTPPRLWCSDLLKSLLVGGLLLTLVASGALALVLASPNWWWLWVWGFFALVTLTLIYLSPVLIEPLFFKFTPLSRTGLAVQAKALMARAGLQIERVQQVDASRRSRHSNAYFTGIGKVKRIVLFDTLLEQMADDEILAVLAHEAGHWRLGHIWKRLLGMELVALAGCLLAWGLLDQGVLPGLLDLPAAGFVAQLLILGFLASLVGFPLTPLFSARSRRHEWQADRFAAELTGEPEALARALVKLSRENLSNLHPHPWYAWFYYSHPPAAARVARLQSRASRS